MVQSTALKIVSEISPFDELKNLLSEDLAAVNTIIAERLQTDVPLIPELAGHLIFAGGKRIRPLLTLASHKIVGGHNPKVRFLATAVEFIHTATLLHDDVVDESQLRRGLPTANNVWGNSASVLVGDFLFARSFQLMVEGGGPELLSVLADAAACMTQGEVLQLTRAKELDTTLDELITIIGSKTAALFAAACRVGAMSADCPQEAFLLRDYGHALGMAFQIADDILDYQGSADSLGKTIGDDFDEGKMTLPVYFAYAKATGEEKLFWRRTMGDMDQQPGDLEHAISLMHTHNAFGQCYDLAAHYAEEAMRSLLMLPSSPLRYSLERLVQYCINRRK